jgi:hypothetical protein
VYRLASRASLPSSRSDLAEPGSARYSTEPSLARLGSFPALATIQEGNSCQAIRFRIDRHILKRGTLAISLLMLLGVI